MNIDNSPDPMTISLFHKVSPLLYLAAGLIGVPFGLSPAFASRHSGNLISPLATFARIALNAATSA